MRRATWRFCLPSVRPRSATAVVAARKGRKLVIRKGIWQKLIPVLQRVVV